MESKKSPVLFPSELSGRDLRAVTARMAHPDDPLAEWRSDFDEWRNAYADLQKMEQEQIVSPELPSSLMQRRHRYLLFLLMTRGEALALALFQEGIPEPERARLLEQVDAFLGCLRDSWHTWHGESLPQHRQALSGFLA